MAEAARRDAGMDADPSLGLSDPWVDGYLHTSTRIYGETMQSGTGGVPKLVFGLRWVTPEPRDPDDLVSTLQECLAVPKP